MNVGDPNDDAGQKALDYATDNVEKVLAEMDLMELCKEFAISDSDLQDILQSFIDSWAELSPECREAICVAICTAIRTNPDYQQRMSEKLQEKHRAGEAG